MYYYRILAAVFTLLCFYGCPPIGPTEEQRMRWRETDPCADSPFVALSKKPQDSLTSFESVQLAQLQFNCDAWMRYREEHVSVHDNSGMLWLLMLPLAGITLALLAALL